MRLRLRLCGAWRWLWRRRRLRAVLRVGRWRRQRRRLWLRGGEGIARGAARQGFEWIDKGVEIERGGLSRRVAAGRRARLGRIRRGDLPGDLVEAGVRIALERIFRKMSLGLRRIGRL